MHRQIYTRDVDVVQLEYTALGQYALDFRRIACVLFEHDIYFQSIGRGLARHARAPRKTKARFEYLRALRYELSILPRFDRIQVCSPENGEYLLSFCPALAGRIDDNRAGIATSRYDSARTAASRTPCCFSEAFAIRRTGSAGLVRAQSAPACARAVPRGAPGDRWRRSAAAPFPARSSEAIELRGFVEDVREPLARYAVFVCPILSGSGMRVKLLEAFAAGIPVVSTRIGAEGLAAKTARSARSPTIRRNSPRKYSSFSTTRSRRKN